MSIEDDFFKNVNFHSYISLEIRDNPDTSNSDVNPFIADNYSFAVNNENYLVTKTRDIEYDLDLGVFTFRAAGDYFIFFKTLRGGNSQSDKAGCAIYQNGELILKTDLVSITFDTPGGTAGTTPANAEILAHKIVSIKKNDVIKVMIDEDGGLYSDQQSATTFVAIKINGAYANSIIDDLAGGYGTSAADGGSDLFTLDASGVSIYDTGDLSFSDPDGGGSGQAGVITTKTRDVTYTANNGFFQPSENKFFAMLSTIYLDMSGGVGHAENEITIKNASNSSIVTISPRLATLTGSQYQPISTTTTLFSAVSGASSHKVDPFLDDDGGPVNTLGASLKRGTSYSMFDFSNNGSDPSSYMAFELDSDSDNDDDISDPATGFVIFSTASHNNNVQRNHISSNGITFDPDGGKFTVSEKGDYFVLSTLVIDHAGANDEEEPFGMSGGGEFSFLKNTNEVKIQGLHDNDGVNNELPQLLHATHFFVTGALQPHHQTTCFIAPFEANDYMTVTALNLGGDTKISEGSTIAMVKIDGIGGSREIDPEGNHFVMTTDNTSYKGTNWKTTSGGYYRGDYVNAGADPEIKDNYTFNTHEERVKGAQRDKIKNSQVPFSAASEGPRNIRGRITSYNVTSGGKK